MLFRNRFRSSQAMINAGMLCCALGLVMQRFIHPPTEFLQGFVAGLSGALIGLSIVFNVRGLVLARGRRFDGE